MLRYIKSWVIGHLFRVNIYLNKFQINKFKIGVCNAYLVRTCIAATVCT